MCIRDSLNADVSKLPRGGFKQTRHYRPIIAKFRCRSARASTWPDSGGDGDFKTGSAGIKSGVGNPNADRLSGRG